MDDYVLVTCIGQGSSGAVYLARSTVIKKLVAIKKIEIDESRRSRCRKAVIREANILRTLNHYHIVKCHEWFLENKGHSISMILEYCDGGTMQDRIALVKQRNSQIPEQKILEWTAQITSAVDYIHERKILHRDLKSENVFLLKSEVVKLGDFGISKEVNHTLDKANTCVGTPCYLSPELCQDIPYNFKSDIWALGCLVFEMCALKPAFDAANLISLFYKIVNGKYSDLPPTCTGPQRELISKILVRNPDDRPTARQLLRLPSLQSYASRIRVRSPELTISREEASGDKSPPRDNYKTGDMDDLDDLLNQAEKELNLKGPSDPTFDQVGPNRSASVYDHFGTSENRQDEDFNAENDPDANRPQTCPHSAARREETYTPADTIATWSGFGDRGSKRPSARRRFSSSDSSSLSEASTLPDPIPTQRDYSSDEFSSLSDDDVTTARTAADEEIPEEIESFDDCRDPSPAPSNVLGVSAPRNLPGSAWLQSKRAQVLRQKEQPPQVLTSVSKRNTLVNSISSSFGVKADFTSVKKANSSSLDVRSSNQSLSRKERLPGSSWLKNKSSGNEIVLGAPVYSPEKRKHNNLPGSGWLLSKSKNSAKTNSSTYDYVDDFEDYDDDFEQDVDDDSDDDLADHHLSSLELIKQQCIDSIGKENFEKLRRLFANGLSIGEVYEKCKNKVDFETVETCYLLRN